MTDDQYRIQKFLGVRVLLQAFKTHLGETKLFLTQTLSYQALRIRTFADHPEVWNQIKLAPQALPSAVQNTKHALLLEASKI